jgi:hypothetical protein
LAVGTTFSLIFWCSRRRIVVFRSACENRAKEKQNMSNQIVGFPEVQDRVVHEFPLFFSSLPALQSALNTLTTAAYDSLSAEQHLILNLGILAGIDLMETVLLGVNGFGPGAMKAVRSLLEAAVTAEYLRLHPTEYNDFQEFVHIERFKEVEFMREYSPDLYKQLQEEGVVAELTTHRDRVATRFGKRPAWCRRDLAERAKQTGYLESYRVLTPTASSFVHVTHYGLMKRFEKDDNYRVGVPPSMSWLMQAFVSGHTLTLGIVHTLIRTLDPSQEALFTALERDYRQAWPPIESVSS